MVSPLIPLERPQVDSALAALLRRRGSTKSYSADRLELAALSQLLSITVGATPDGPRPYGSAHARYDIALTVVAGVIYGLAAGAYRYLPTEHSLLPVAEGDHRSALADGTLDAQWLPDCPVVLILSADLLAANSAFAAQSQGRGERFCWLEAGLITQNIYLWCAENDLGCVFLGGLDSAEIGAAARRLLPPSHTVLGLIPIGYPRPSGTST